LILYGVGVGPGDPDLVTIGAFRTLEAADVVFIPVSSEEKNSIAGEIYSKLSGERKTYPFWFPMTNDLTKRDAEISRQLEEYAPVWRGAKSVALPVIGDSVLYSTAAYLYSVWRGICPELELRLLPGISAHSLSSSLAGQFLVEGTERLSILPGSGELSKLAQTMSVSECVALYKPSALGDALPKLVRDTGPWSRTVRVHRAGLPEQHVICGVEASNPTDDYLSVLLLWRDRA
jgi:precorrin-2/cobalt-factor-2 C20-methyltransferase